ncbi:hypothetical protein ID866_13255 [Astraeus odoratus]|nr:hypothetical protein ID866_13255 [Astraeus odoratus]
MSPMSSPMWHRCWARLLIPFPAPLAQAIPCL